MGSIFGGDDESTAASCDGGRPSLSGFLGERGAKRDLLHELRDGWDEGRPEPLENLLTRWPTDPDADPDAASLLAEDFLRRRQTGEEPSVLEYQDRFPAAARSLAGLISNQALFRSLGGESAGPSRLLRLPDVGDEVFGFRLRHPLGRGAFARVFLAEQADLAGRPVVLKISAIEGTEPQTLAQLQHTNIVPIYSVHEDARAGIRAVCMPYFGGASLSAVLRNLWEGSAPAGQAGRGGLPAHGRQYVGALGAVRLPTLGELDAAPGGGRPPAPHDPQSPLARLERMTYCQAAAWVVAGLADGLHHAHQRGILHRDVKPSNVLIASDGEPLLLDFNLAQDQGDDPAGATLGGTVAYMAPEHLRALVGRNAALAARVDRRSDVYSLGMVLAEMLSGRNPFDQSASYSVLPLQIEAMALERSAAAPSVRGERPDVPWGLEGVARKCLAPDPADRYQSADQLAEDLRRFLDDRPLKYAPELSRVEQVRKYLRRHPRLTSTGPLAVVAAVLIAGAAAALTGVRGHLATARENLAAAHARQRFEAHEAGATRALCLVNTAVDLQDNLREGAAVCEETLRLYDQPGGRTLREHPDWPRLSPAQRQKLAEDRRELRMLLAGAKVRTARGSESAAREALALLDLAEKPGELPPSRALFLDRALYLELTGQVRAAAEARRRAERTPATSARDHYLLATSYARQGGPDAYARAVAELDLALALNPRHYWSAVQRGVCHLEMGEYVLAAGDFGACTGLWPEFAWGYFNRGCVLDRSGRKAEAVDDYSAALERDPGFLPAYVNRGLARLELGRTPAALGDFDAALARGATGAAPHAGRGIALESLGRPAEADAAFRRAFAEGRGLPAAARARLGWTYGFAVSARLPSAAKAAFERALAADPKNPQSLYGLGMLAAVRGETDEAVRMFDRAAEANPGFVEARRALAVQLARQKRWWRAEREINWCLDREPRSVPTLYAAACVAARQAAGGDDPDAAAQAVELLTRAAECGPLPAGAADDPDLAALRTVPGFRRLTSPAPPAPRRAEPTPTPSRRTEPS